MKRDRLSVEVIGAGGHAKVVIATLAACGYNVIGIFDDDPKTHDRMILGIPVLGSLAEMDDKADTGRLIAIGHNETRKNISDRFPSANWITVVHPRAFVHESALLGSGTIVMAGVTIQPEARIGKHGIVNTCASIDHDCLLGDYVHIAPGCHLAGSVQLGEGVFMGIHSAAVPGIRIGDWSIIGAGGVVIENLPGGIVAVGVPSRVKKASRKVSK